MKPEDQDRKEWLHALSMVTGAGITLASTLAVGLGGGYLLDSYIPWSFPIGMLLGGLLGSVAAFWAIYKQLQ